MPRASAIYRGWVRHRRYAPKPNNFKYPIFMMYLDLDELEELFKPYRFWSLNKKNIAEFRRSDHTGDKGTPLKKSVMDMVFKATGWMPDGPIRLLTHLRYFGYCMNPVSFYYCFDASGDRVKTIVAEVHNTPWNEEHCYVLHNETESHKTLKFQFSKVFHVSPFMGMNQDYDWQFTQPQSNDDSPLLVHMNNLEHLPQHQAEDASEEQKKIFDATMRLNRQPITSGNLNRVLLRYPFMTANVILKIHWQALKLYLKKIPVQVYPGKHEEAATIAANH